MCFQTKVYFHKKIIGCFENTCELQGASLATKCNTSLSSDDNNKKIN